MSTPKTPSQAEKANASSDEEGDEGAHEAGRGEHQDAAEDQ